MDATISQKMVNQPLCRVTPQLSGLVAVLRAS